MKIHRFFCDFTVTDNKILLVDKDLNKQIKNVLRLQTGEKISLFDSNSREVLCVIDAIEKDQIVLSVVEELKSNKKAGNNVSLYCAVLKKENFELVVQKATEIGVTSIVPIITARTIKTNLNLERLKKIIKEAVEQSGRRDIPKLGAITKLNEALDQIGGCENKICFDFSGQDWGKYKTKNARPPSHKLGAGEGKDLAIFVGPEGGWGEEELEIFKKNDFSILSLGESTLRAETAAIVASYLIINSF